MSLITEQKNASEMEAFVFLNSISLLAHEEVFDGMDRRASADGGDGFCEWDALGTDLDAVLGVATVLDAAWAGEGVHAFVFESFAGVVFVEEAGLRDGLWADEV